MRKSMTYRDVLLCLLYSPGAYGKNNEQIIGRLKLTKAIYLFEKELYPKYFSNNLDISFPEYINGEFGPLSKDIYGALAFFQSMGMISLKTTTYPTIPADAIEYEIVCDDEIYNDWEMQSDFEDFNEGCEISYKLSGPGIGVVKERLWGTLTNLQRVKLQEFKVRICKTPIKRLIEHIQQDYPLQVKDCSQI